MCTIINRFLVALFHGELDVPKKVIFITKFSTNRAATNKLEGMPGVYTNVAEYVDWIHEKTAESGFPLA